MKRKIVVEIEYPDNVSSLWDEDKSGMQVFNDSIEKFARFEAVMALGRVIKDCKKRKIITEEQRKKDPYYQYIMRNIEIVNSMHPIGYVDDNGKVLIYNKDTCKWEE